MGIGILNFSFLYKKFSTKTYIKVKFILLSTKNVKIILLNIFYSNLITKC